MSKKSIPLFRRGYVRSSIAEIRKHFALTEPGVRGPDDRIEDIGTVHQAVLDAQRSKDFFYSEFYLRTYDRADWRGSSLEIRLFVHKFMRALRARGLPFYVHTCYRSPADQRELVAQGHSQVSNGAHQRSAAVDIVSAVDHWDIPRSLWSYVGSVGEQVARGHDFGKGEDGQTLHIEWGGRWDFYDPAHWQLSDWRHRPVVKDERPLRFSPYSSMMRF